MSQPIADVLRMLQGGVISCQAGDAFAEIIKAVEQTGKPGKMSITLDVKKVGVAISVLCTVVDRTPEKAPDADLFYATEDGRLSVDNPRQRKLDLRPVDQAPDSLRSA